jgi:hypothetical protein
MTKSGEQPQNDNAAVVNSKAEAERCRRLSRATYDRATSEMLNRMAESFERGHSR